MQPNPETPEQMLEMRYLRSSSRRRLAASSIGCRRRSTPPMRRAHVTYWNAACVEFAGREPQLGRDRWCVTWQLYTTIGEPWRMRIARWPTRSATRRDPRRNRHRRTARRQRRAFRPYPTPLFDKDGSLTGAINLLIDITDEQARRFTNKPSAAAA